MLPGELYTRAVCIVASTKITQNIAQTMFMKVLNDTPNARANATRCLI